MFQELALAREQQRDAHNARVTQAWFGELFARQKRLKDVKLFWWKADPRPQTPDELRSALQQLAKQYGGKVRTVTG